MNKKEVFESIVSSFESKYSFLGKDVAEEFLYSVASWNIQQYSHPDFRVRRHLLLFWPASWYKSSILLKFQEILGDGLSTFLSDISVAALRGTVEGREFVSPFTLKRPFSICTEFGQVVNGFDQTEVTQKLLNVLEEGKLNVCLGKISYLDPLSKLNIEEKYGVRFIDNNTFTYKTNWVLFAATYNKKFLVDSALESRFNIIMPSQPLDNNLIRHVNNSKPFFVEEEAKFVLKSELLNEKVCETRVKLPNSLFNDSLQINPRENASLISFKLCRDWWGLTTSEEQLRERLFSMKERADMIWQTPEDRIFDLIENNAKTLKEIALETGYSKRLVWQTIRNLKAYRTENFEGELAWRMTWT